MYGWGEPVYGFCDSTGQVDLSSRQGGAGRREKNEYSLTVKNILQDIDFRETFVPGVSCRTS
jgi:hypothetical protein